MHPTLISAGAPPQRISVFSMATNDVPADCKGPESSSKRHSELCSSFDKFRIAAFHRGEMLQCCRQQFFCINCQTSKDNHHLIVCCSTRA